MAVRGFLFGRSRPAGERPASIDYTRFVHFMKIALTSMAIALLGVVVLWGRLTQQTDAFRIGYANIGPETVNDLHMTNARYAGVDEANHPYSVTADDAVQRPGDSDVYDLVAPKADFISRSGDGVVIIADRGVYYQRTQKVELRGNVAVYHDQGYEMHTEGADVDLKTNTAEGQWAVQGQGPQGHLEGDGFKILEGADRILVTGRASMTLRGETHPAVASGTRKSR